jgi:Tfp pilus assembly protein PilF
MGALLHAQGGAGGEINSGQLAEARASLQRAIQLDPEYPLPVVSLGDIAMAEADVNAAVEHYAYVCACPMLCCSDTCC